MCGNPFKPPKIKAKDPVPAAPIQKEIETQLAPEIASSDSERETLKKRKTGRSALRIDRDGAVPGAGTGLNIPKA